MNFLPGLDEAALRRAGKKIMGWLLAGEHAAIAQRYG